MEKKKEIIIKGVAYERIDIRMSKASDISELKAKGIGDQNLIILKIGESLLFPLLADINRIRTIIEEESFKSKVSIVIRIEIKSSYRFKKIEALSNLIKCEKVIGFETCDNDFLLNFNLQLLNHLLKFNAIFKKDFYKASINRGKEIIINLSSTCECTLQTSISTNLIKAFETRISKNTINFLKVLDKDDDIYLYATKKELGVTWTLPFNGLRNILKSKKLSFVNIVYLFVLYEGKIERKNQKAFFKIFNTSKVIKGVGFYKKSFNKGSNDGTVVKDYNCLIERDLTTFFCALREVKKGNVNDKCVIWIKRCLLSIETNLLIREITKQSETTFRFSFVSKFNYLMVKAHSNYLKVLLSASLVSKTLETKQLKSHFNALNKFKNRERQRERENS